MSTARTSNHPSIPADSNRELAESRLADLIGLFAIIDLLFLPRLMFAFGIPLSLPIVIAWLARKRLQRVTVAMWLAMGLVTIASVTSSSFSNDGNIAFENLKRAFQILSILIYAFFIMDMKSVSSRLNIIIRFFFIYCALLAIIFFAFPETYVSVFSNLYTESKDMISTNLEYFRFPLYFSDPNSAAYFLCLVLTLYLSSETSKFWGIFCGILASGVIILTQSRGGYVALLLILMTKLFLSKAKTSTKAYVSILIISILLVFIISYLEEINLALKIFSSRFGEESDLGGGRFGKYEYFLNNINVLPFGDGYKLRISEQEFRPHSDFIRLNLSYGILALPIIMYFCFPRNRNQVLIFCIFVIPFLINTIIDDYRMFGFYLLSIGLLKNAETLENQNPVLRI